MASDWSAPTFLLDVDQPTLTPLALRSETKRLSYQIHDHWNKLNQIICGHEPTIQARWKKKTSAQRRTLLLAAWPTMPKVHRPDFDAWKMISYSNYQAEHADAWQWPYINLEDLLNPRILPLLLSSRGHNHPEVFARMDLKAASLGISIGAIKICFVVGCHGMLLAGQKTPDTYGRVISFEDDPDITNLLRSRHAALPGKGLLILQFQERLYRFLFEICLKILHDLTNNMLYTPNVTSPPPPDLVAVSESAVSDSAVSLLDSLEEAPYKLPSGLILERIVSIASAKVTATEDHLSGLREDPAYYEEAIITSKEHGAIFLPDTNGRKHPLLCPPESPNFVWHRGITLAIDLALKRLEIWGLLRDELLDLKLKTKDVDHITAPQKYEREFYLLHRTIRTCITSLTFDLNDQIPGSPLMRSYFVRDSVNPNKIQLRAGILEKSTDRNVRHLLHLLILIGQSQHIDNIGLGSVLDEITRLYEKETVCRRLITPLVMQLLGDLSILAHCIYQLELLPHWRAYVPNQHEKKLSPALDQLNKLNKTYVTAKANVSDYLITLGMPLKGRFRYPAGKARTKENVCAMRAAEANLDQFWDQLRQELLDKATESPRVLALQQIFSKRQLERTPEWTASLPEDSEPKEESLTQQVDNWHISTEPSHPNEKHTASNPKQKVKTHGLPHTDTATAEPAAIVELPQQEPAFQVDARAMKVFSTMFHKPSTRHHLGEVSWKDFLYALQAIGFGVEKLDGSAWQFTPTRMDVQASIQIHDPHPSHKIPFFNLRHHGRRLTKLTACMEVCSI
ncbi:hypothetical protein BT63DRAFT_129988 [Microthyrium microscopicum]|uniref:Uncharacterized protein n=1 Tax=Microthyrium microscopicum TaxID=703497 RepID=A0A6A6TUI6_9PEZI|nr:hypothetical protein BT63DRAFT_129988 [Microthyrium microscopicum]